MPMQPAPRNLRAWATSSSGPTSRHGTSSRPAWAIEAFWQKGHDRLQPKLPTDSTVEPGWNRASGFFSIGSSASEMIRP